MTDRHTIISGLRDCGRNFVDSVVPILERQRSEAALDLYQPVTDEVIGGLFARVFRFLQTFAIDYHLWSEDIGRVVLRMMLETVFTLRFLSEQKQPESALAFQKYGIGQEKLYKLQLRKLLEEGTLKDSPELRQFIDSDSDEEIWEELVIVKLKNFEDLRKLATDAGMKNEYVLHYQPDSMVVHGHWPILRQYYLERCLEPLHRFHLQPTFGLPPLDPGLLERAFGLFLRAYEVWIKHYGLIDRVTPLVKNYFEGCDAVAQIETPPET